jgi:MoxR-like ATPase
MFSIIIGYLPREHELEVVASTTSSKVPKLNRTMSGKDLLEYHSIVREIPVAEPIIRYAVQLAAHSRPSCGEAPGFVKEYVSWGASIRASHYLVLAAKARAILSGRFNVSVKDIQAVALPVLRHRITTNFRAESAGVNSEKLVHMLLESVPVPKSGL